MERDKIYTCKNCQYEFNEWNLLCLDDTSKREKLLDTFLQNSLQIEDYETAAIIRDTKNSINMVLISRLEGKNLLEV